MWSATTAYGLAARVVDSPQSVPRELSFLSQHHGETLPPSLFSRVHASTLQSARVFTASVDFLFDHLPNGIAVCP